MVGRCRSLAKNSLKVSRVSNQVGQGSIVSSQAGPRCNSARQLGQQGSQVGQYNGTQYWEKQKSRVNNIRLKSDEKNAAQPMDRTINSCIGGWLFTLAKCGSIVLTVWLDTLLALPLGKRLCCNMMFILSFLK